MSYNKLTPQEEDVIEGKRTEAPFTGEYDDFYKRSLKTSSESKLSNSVYEAGVFICKKCNAPLFDLESKFDAGCGWPSFDEEYPNSLKRVIDADGIRTEIQCVNCGAHLGHEFTGEHLTDKNTRHCVNSLSIKFVPKDQKLPEVIQE